MVGRAAAGARRRRGAGGGANCDTRGGSTTGFASLQALLLLATPPPGDWEKGFHVVAARKKVSTVIPFAKRFHVATCFHVGAMTATWKRISRNRKLLNGKRFPRRAREKGFHVTPRASNVSTSKGSAADAKRFPRSRHAENVSPSARFRECFPVAAMACTWKPFRQRFPRGCDPWDPKGTKRFYRNVSTSLPWCAAGPERFPVGLWGNGAIRSSDGET